MLNSWNPPTIPQSNEGFTIAPNRSFSWETFAFAKASLLWSSPVVDTTCWSLATWTRHLGEGTRRHTHGVLQGISCNHPAILTWAQRRSNDIPLVARMVPESLLWTPCLHVSLTQNICDQWCHWWRLTKGLVPCVFSQLRFGTGPLWQYSARCSNLLDKVCQQQIESHFRNFCYSRPPKANLSAEQCCAMLCNALHEELHFQHFSFSASSGSETQELRANCAPILNGFVAKLAGKKLKIASGWIIEICT